MFLLSNVYSWGAPDTPTPTANAKHPLRRNKAPGWRSASLQTSSHPPPPSPCSPPPSDPSLCITIKIKKEEVPQGCDGVGRGKNPWGGRAQGE